MKDILLFSDVSMAYSSNINNLNEAKQIFETECKGLNDRILNLADEICTARNKDKNRFLRSIFYWGECTDSESSKKNGNWVSFTQRTSLGLCIKAPGRKNFDNNVAFLSFEIAFDQDLKRFMFKVKFDNLYAKNDQLDERLYALASQSGFFKNGLHIKSSSTILGSWELNAELSESVNEIVVKSLDLVQEMILLEFPENLYNKADTETTQGDGSEKVA